MDNYQLVVWNLWKTMQPDLAQMNQMMTAALLIKANMERYEIVANSIGCPAWILGAIHFRESSCSFNHHLHNGDPLTAQTIHVPKGRPMGEPPFGWEDSALDALALKGWDRIQHWDFVSCLITAEHYNGFGYKLNGHASPYIWDLTNHYQSGLYVADGTYDPNKVENRPGVAAIAFTLRTMGFNLEEYPPG